ncbi:hypothetical protein MP228_011869 [Amoeboaphelidium protococcarum]|nr:hypothetical protein MP228_011869 [Amoeboaphelidium protococcarum]
MVRLNVRHPLGIKPEGNQLIDSGNAGFIANVRQNGLGSLSTLDDQLIYYVFSMLDARSLAKIASVSKAAYCWSYYDEFWKPLVLSDYKSEFVWAGQSWRQTYAYNARLLQTSSDSDNQQPSLDNIAPVQVSYFYSDFLFQAYVSLAAEIDREWVKVDNIDRRSDLSVEDFMREYEIPNKPIVIADCVQKWPCFSKWTREYLISNYGNVEFRAEAMQTSLQNYLKYSDQALEEAPLYLFDSQFVQKCPEMGRDFQVPDYFSEDLFKLLGQYKRPDYRWLILGPAKSGSTFHKDPNATSAWNATIYGSKKWVMFPPEVTPPGIHPNHDGSEVTTPISVVEWFINYYKEARLLNPIECVTKAGDLIFVPSGWWHCVINLEETLAITQNFVSSANLTEVLHLLKYKKSHISGVPCSYVDSIGEDFEKILLDHGYVLKDAVHKKRKLQCELSSESQDKNSKKKQPSWWADSCNSEFTLF